MSTGKLRDRGNNKQKHTNINNYQCVHWHYDFNSNQDIINEYKNKHYDFNITNEIWYRENYFL